MGAAERNLEKIKALRKKKYNKSCFNCGEKGPSYICTNFSIFVCTACSGVHRNFTHRVKSISMASFTDEETQALEEGEGNKAAEKMFLGKWTAAALARPSSDNSHKVEEWIRMYSTC